jgi:hypothetical protein
MAEELSPDTQAAQKGLHCKVMDLHFEKNKADGIQA